MPHSRLVGDSISVGRLSLSFQRTLRLPDDGNTWPLPPGLGRFPIRRVRDHARRVPSEWRKTGGYFIPMYQCEAMWISLSGAHWKPNALKIGIGGVNAISGKRFDKRLRRRAQDYVVVPKQPWLDGINAGPGMIRQFVAAPLGRGLTVEAQVTGAEEEGGMQFTVVEPVAGRFPDRPPQPSHAAGSWILCESPADYSMGLGAGGRMEQKIYADTYGRGTWDNERTSTFHVHIANSAAWRTITGEDPPPSPVSVESYIRFGLPWFGLYDEHLGDVEAPEALARVKSIGELVSQ